METTLVLLHKIDMEKLNDVIEEMKTLGSPTLRGIVSDDCVYLCEGTHRATAAAKLGLTVYIDEIDPIDIDDLLSDYFEHDMDVDITISDVLNIKSHIAVNCDVIIL